MVSIASSVQSDALEQILLAQLQVPAPTLRALRRVRELERELMLLRGALTDPSAQAQPEIAKQLQVANLLSRVVLFRMALADPSKFDDTVSSSGRDISPAIAYRALRD